MWTGRRISEAAMSHRDDHRHARAADTLLAALAGLAIGAGLGAAAMVVGWLLRQLGPNL